MQETGSIMKSAAVLMKDRGLKSETDNGPRTVLYQDS